MDTRRRRNPLDPDFRFTLPPFSCANKIKMKKKNVILIEKGGGNRIEVNVRAVNYASGDETLKTMLILLRKRLLIQQSYKNVK